MTEPGGDQLHVLVGVDHHPGGHAALHHGADLAARLNAHLAVMHVQAMSLSDLAGYTVPPSLGGIPPDLDRRPALNPETAQLREQVARALAAHPVTWTFHLAKGDPGQALAELADTLNAYCVVVASRGEGLGPLLHRLLRPSVSHALIRTRLRPVLVVAPDPDLAP